MGKLIKNLERIVGKGILAGALAFVPSITSAEVLVEPRPEDTSRAIAKWERGKNYRVNVWAQNNGPESIRGAQWRLNIPSDLESYLTCANSCILNQDYGRPSANEDFFSGVQLFWSNYAPVGALSGATVQSVPAPPGRQGSLEFYDFSVGNDAPLGNFDFLLTDTVFTYSGGGGAFPIIQDNYQFRIMPRKGDVNADGNVDASDIYIFTQVLLGNDTDASHREYSDWSGNDDGQLDGRDIQGFVNALISG